MLGAAPAAQSHDRELGIDDPHKLIADMWTAVQESVEARFFSEADWERLRFELWYANQAMRSGRPVSGHAWAAIQHGLTELLVSPAAKRRAAIELKPAGVDADEVAAVSMLGTYRSKLPVMTTEGQDGEPAHNRSATYQGTRPLAHGPSPGDRYLGLPARCDVEDLGDNEIQNRWLAPIATR